MKKVAIVNRTNLKNYGSVLQVYALCEAIRCMGYFPEVLWEKGNLSKNWDIRPRKILNVISKMLFHPRLLVETLKTILEVRGNKVPEVKADKFDVFVNLHLIRKFYSFRELKQLAESNEYYKFVCGSDQVWCSTALYVDPMMYLRFAPQAKRIAYAPSLGRNYIPQYNARTMKCYIEEFDSISVREEDGQRLVADLINRHVSLVVDPTLLLKKAEWDLIKSPVKHKDYILCYFLDCPKPQFLDWLYGFAEKENLLVITLNNNIPEIPGRVFVSVAGVDEFLGLIDEAELVLTDSYHGMLFSIIYQKRFWSIERNYSQYDQSSRQKNILKLIGLEDRYVVEPTFVDMSQIDYVKVSKQLDKERAKSLSFLLGALNKSN